jgi:hypothetical protein
LRRENVSAERQRDHESNAKHTVHGFAPITKI